jgi:ABC-type uncharacterized transport system involved in gliding motility auxiliary subunit
MSNKNLIHALFLILNIFIYVSCLLVWNIPSISLMVKISVSLSNVFFSIFILAILGLKKVRILVYKLILPMTNLLLLLSVLGLINYLSFQYSFSYDFSPREMNSLTKETKKIVKNIKSDLSLTVFARKKDAALILPILKLYKDINYKFNIDVINPDLRPDLVAHEQINYPSVVKFKYNDRIEYVHKHTEIDYTNAIIKVIRQENPVVYFSKGKNEIRISENGDTTASHLKEVLISSLNEVKEINLLTLEEIPNDASVLIFLGPKKEFSHNELLIVDKYLNRGGKLIVALDPAFQGGSSTNLRNFLLEKWGVGISNELVIDINKFVSGSKGTVPIASSFDASILEGFGGTVFFPLVSRVYQGKKTNKNLKFKSLVQTSEFPSSWADKTPGELIENEIKFHSGEDIPGPITVVGISTNIGRVKTQVAVFGNATFLQNSYAQMGGNIDLFSRVVGFLTSENLLQSFNLPIHTNKPIVFTSKEKRNHFIWPVLVIPFLLFLLFVYLLRRQRSL